MFVVLFFFFFNDTATTEIYTLSLHDALPILALVMWAFGVDLSLVEVMTVFGVSQIAAGIPGTPGGIGFAEAGLIGSLAFFGVDPAVAVAPVLVFRVVHYWLPAGAGLVAGTSAFLRSAEAAA